MFLNILEFHLMFFVSTLLAPYCLHLSIHVFCEQDMAAILEVSVVRFKRVFDIRWLSLGNSEPLMAVLEESAAAGDATAIGKSTTRA